MKICEASTATMYVTPVRSVQYLDRVAAPGMGQGVITLRARALYTTAAMPRQNAHVHGLLNHISEPIKPAQGMERGWKRERERSARACAWEAEAEPHTQRCRDRKTRKETEKAKEKPSALHAKVVLTTP